MLQRLATRHNVPLASFLLMLFVVVCAPHVTAQDASQGATPGALSAFGAKGAARGLCPLKHTDVRASVAGFLARVTVTQEFENPFKEKIEAVYTFPLPQGAAVDDMTMRVGERTVKGKIMRREEAGEVYRAARDAGQVASLLDQERPNVFTQSVVNVMPGEKVSGREREFLRRPHRRHHHLQVRHAAVLRRLQRAVRLPLQRRGGAGFERAVSVKG